MEAMTTDAMAYTEAFYGGRIPESKKQVASIDIVKLVAIVKGDLRREFGEASSEMLDKGTLSTLIMMRQLGASSPEIYYQKTELSIKAFQSGVTRVKDLLTAEQIETEKREFLQSRDAQKEQRYPVMAQINEDFSKFKQSAIEHGYEKPALEAWKGLVVNMGNYDLGGIGYFLINWQIPRENNLLYDPEVIKICKDHPRLLDRSQPRLMVNNKLWTG